MAAVPSRSCANADCRVAETGKCVEGLEIASCPQFGRISEAIQSPAEASPEPVIALELSGADRLDLKRTEGLLRRGTCKVVALLGANEAGKTTLIASVYDLLQQGPLGAHEFWRSHSLFAFERACHDSRSASVRSEPFTERTSRGEFGFYHIGMAKPHSSERLDLLLSDRAGEEYRGAVDQPKIFEEFVEIPRADVICVLVDGRRLLDLGSRHNVRSGARMMVRVLADSGLIHTSQRLALVLTKFDEIKQSGEGDRAQRDFDSMVAAVTDEHLSHFSQISSFRVAASPKSEALPRGFGVLDLLEYWLQPSEFSHSKLPHPPSSRLFGRINAG